LKLRFSSPLLARSRGADAANGSLATTFAQRLLTTSLRALNHAGGLTAASHLATTTITTLCHIQIP
jgi:hypothetical protein